MPILKNVKHERFAQEIIKGKSANEAYALAGYKPNDGNCIRLKGNERIKIRIAELQTKIANRIEITTARVLEELGKLGFSSMGNYVTIGADGLPFADFTKVTPDQMAAVT